ncbi:hypothetical protein F5Y16DRAFT_411223 [Xylariaceae sp. FL0255]|nr:hypothetical protein F5Y16DRAFT_411223 [Xylariaceae sp. FL0255]
MENRLLRTYATFSEDVLYTASDLLLNKGGEAIITSHIRDIFLRYNAYKIYGVALLHKHFAILPTQRLVDIRNVSLPWELGSDTSLELRKYDSRITPRSLRFLGEYVQLYEFDFSTRESPITVDDGFLRHLSEFLYEHGLENILGLKLLELRDPEVSVEVTEGISNIMLPRGAVDDNQLILAMWVFGKDEDDRCNCREYCYTDANKKHTGSNHGCG